MYPVTCRKKYKSECQSSQDYIGSDGSKYPRCLALGRKASRGGLRVVGHGAPCKGCLPESLNLAKLMTISRKDSDLDLMERVDRAVASALDERGL